MSDEELICEFMEPRPEPSAGPDSYSHPWWPQISTSQFDGDHWIIGLKIVPRRLSLDAAYEVEEQIIERGFSDQYRIELSKIDAYFWHATAEQKIKALANTLRLSALPSHPSKTEKETK